MTALYIYLSALTILTVCCLSVIYLVYISSHELTHRLQLIKIMHLTIKKKVHF